MTTDLYPTMQQHKTFAIRLIMLTLVNCLFDTQSAQAGLGSLACNVSMPSINFGAFNTTTAITNFASSVSVTCTATGTGSVAATLSLSKGGSSSFSPRKMISTTNTSNTIDYNLFSESTYTTVWGDGTSPSSTLSITISGQGGTVTPVSKTIYAKIPAPQYSAVPAQDYSDSITVTLTY